MNHVQKQEARLQDEQWQKLEPLLTGKQSDPGANAKNNRLFIEAVLWVVVNKTVWRYLPRQFGSPGTAYMRFRRWTECDFWRQLVQSGIDDAELVRTLEKIVEYSDLYTRRIEQRLLRKKQKAIYKSAVAVAKVVKPPKHTQCAMDESTLHWVGLVTA